jgi:HK97 family phage prohead protease
VTITAPEALPVLGDELVRSIPEALREVNRKEGIVEALIAPYMTPTTIVEPYDGRIVEYREQFARGSFDRAKAVPRRVALTYTHSHHMPDRMGYGIELRDSAEGAVMVWQLMRDTLDRSIELLETTHTGMSVTFRSIAPRFVTPDRDGALVTREAVHLISVAATDDPAYTDARVLALRARDAELEAERVAQAAKRAQYVDGLLFLRARGRDLSPDQAAYLAEHGHPAP